MIEDGVNSDILKEALARLRNLRQIVFTDFRELAREGEGYNFLCKRIFDNTLEPHGLSFSDNVCQEFLLLMSMIAETPRTNIQSLSIGGHPYESFVDFWATNERGRGLMHCSFCPPAIPYEPNHHPDDVESARQVCRKLRHLRLPIRFQSDILPQISPDIETGLDGTFVCRVLHFSSPGLVQLLLCAVDLLRYGRGEGICIRGGSRCLESLLFPLTFTSLQHLELCGWPLPGASFRAFLSRHSSTLKELCLSECVVSDDPRVCGQWAGKNMFLSGAKINVKAEWNEEKDDSDWRHWEPVDLEVLWLDGRSNSLRRHDAKQDPQQVENL